MQRRENGAFLNGNKIEVNVRKNRLVGTINLDAEESLKIIEGVIKQKKDIEFRALYCVAATFGYIASGVFDFSIHVGRFGKWDIIPPKLLIEEAGGKCKIVETETNKKVVVATNKYNIQLVEKIVKEYV